MTDNIFVYELFFVIKYFRFYFPFYVKTATTPGKGHVLFPRNPPIKTEIFSSSPFWKFGRSCIFLLSGCFELTVYFSIPINLLVIKPETFIYYIYCIHINCCYFQSNPCSQLPETDNIVWYYHTPSNNWTKKE